MRYKEIIDEYVIDDSIVINIPDFSDGKKIGQLSIKNVTMDVHHIFSVGPDGTEDMYAAVDRQIGPSKPAAFLGFLKRGTNILMLKNIKTDNKYLKMRLASELFYFSAKHAGMVIMSDTIFSSAGETLWKSLMRSGKYISKVAYIQTMQLFDLSEVGITVTADGITVDAPENDNATVYPYVKNVNEHGQKFFYILKAK